MTTFTEKEDGIVYVSIDDSRENDTTGKYLSGPKIKQLLEDGKYEVLREYLKPEIYNKLIQEYEKHKAKLQFLKKEEERKKKQEITKNERLTALRERLSKQTGKQ